MQLTPILLLHICAGAVSVISGAVAMSFRKGSDRHRQAGNVFTIAMLILGATGAYIGFTKHQTLNCSMGILSCYLVATAWLAARRSEQRTDILDRGALLVPLAVGAVLVTYGINTATSPADPTAEYPAAAYFIFGSLALLFAAGDVRILVRGGVSGTRRIARHLWRMSFGFFIASASFFLGRARIFPAAIRDSGVLFLLSFLPLLLGLFWLLRIRSKKQMARLNIPTWNDKPTVRRPSEA